MSDHPEFTRWSRIYAGDEYYYGHEPGPVARRAVRYARPFMEPGARALDAGCGEGQDLVFLVEQGYAATGIEWTPDGARKTRRLLQSRALHAEVVEGDLRRLHELRATASDAPAHYDLVLSVNALQFMGRDAPACLDMLMRLTSPGGVIGLSLFAREDDAPQISGTIFFFTLDELLARFDGWQPLEAARLWQWNAAGEAQAFVTFIARKS